MKRAIGICLVLWALAAPVFAEDSAPKKTISLQFQGTLKDALRKVATEGGINLMITGTLDQSVDVQLTDIPPEEALRAIAGAHQLKIVREGNLWTVRSAESKRGRDGKDLVGSQDMVVNVGETVDNAVAYGGSLRIEGHVEGNAVAFGGGIHLGPEAVVEGNVVTFGGSITREDGAQVEGQVVSMGGLMGGAGNLFTDTIKDFQTPTREPRHHRDDDSLGMTFPDFLLRFALLYGMGFLFMIFAPGRMRELEQELVRGPLKNGLTGLVAFLLLVPMTVLLAITLIGIPLAVVLWMLVGLGVLMGATAIATHLGSLLPVLRGKKTQAVVLALGMGLLLGISWVPGLGPLVVCAVCAVALGLVVRTRFGTRPKGFPEPLERTQVG